MLFVGYPKCTTSQKAKKYLDSSGAVYIERHIKDDNPTLEELRAWHERMSVNNDVENAINAMLKLGKKIGFICIAPVIAGKVISNGVKITIGNDTQTAQAINAMGAEHVNCPADSFVFDEKFNVYSTPAYMLAENTVELDAGIGAMISEMLK